MRNVLVITGLDLYYSVSDHQSNFMQNCSGRGSDKSSDSSSSEGFLLDKGSVEGSGKGSG